MSATIALFFITLGASAWGQAISPPTELDKQLARIDLSVSGKGEFTTSTNGTTPTGQSVFLTPSNTFGALVSLRYIKSPFVGFEANYGYARYTQNFQYTNTTPGGSRLAVLGVQSNASEYTFGYVVHTRHEYFGVLPFASVGAGSVAFRPTKGGGQGFEPQARAAYYYNVGAEQLVYGQHLGLRASFRQVLALAPDFQATYLRQHQRALSSEPTLGFFIRF